MSPLPHRDRRRQANPWHGAALLLEQAAGLGAILAPLALLLASLLRSL